MSRKVLTIALCLAAGVFSALGQDTRGTILGRVTDPSGANIAGADVRATNVATGVAVAAKTNDSGNFSVPYLSPGMYTVTAELAGFKKMVRDNVQVRVNDAVEVNMSLTVGDVTEAVEVTAETPLLSTAEASLGQVVDERRVLELPIFSGNAMELTLLAPGTVNGTDMRLRKAPFNNAPSQFSTDGSGLFNNEFNIDGITNTFSDSRKVRVAFSPPQASIGEFKVQTSIVRCRASATPGLLVNISTKGGTNQIPRIGLVVDAPPELRRSLDFPEPGSQRDRARSRCTRTIATGCPAARRSSSLKSTTARTGPSGSSPGKPTSSAIRTSARTPRRVPRAAWKNGDLSDLLKLGANYQIYDPATIQAAPNGTFTRSIFPNNIIPANRLSPIGKAILDLYPLPNQPGNADGTNNYFLGRKGAGRLLDDDRPRGSRHQRQEPHVRPRPPRFLAGGQEPIPSATT